MQKQFNEGVDNLTRGSVVGEQSGNMSDKKKSTIEPVTKTPEQAARVKELQNKLEKELVALLSHPLVPQEFKNVFEGKE